MQTKNFIYAFIADLFYIKSPINLILGCFTLILFSCSCISRNTILKSPSGNIVIEIQDTDSLNYSVSMEGKSIVSNSSLGICFENKNVATNQCVIKSHHVTEINETYTTRGKKSSALNHCNELTLDLLAEKTGHEYILFIRAYNDGIAIRYEVEEEKLCKVNGEFTQWRFPDGAIAWLQDSEGKYMERYKNDGFGTSGHHQAAPGYHQRVYQAMYFETLLNSLEFNSLVGGPILLKLPDSGIYVWMAEGALLNYPGSRYLLTAANTFGLTFPEEGPWAMQGSFKTPWRLLVISKDLNGIVNTDMHTSVCPQPSPKLENAEWIVPGRATWSWYSGQTGDVELQKQYIDWAAELGFEYNLIDANWEKSFTSKYPYIGHDHWEVLKEVTDYAMEQGVKIWVWQHSKNLKDPTERENYLHNLNRVNVAGVKVDFFDTESKETIDYMKALTEDAARHKIMLDFHGAPKATGLSRTYPHELTREANRGSEWHTRIWGKGRELTPKHNVITVFTRDVLGNNDYTPVVFDSVHLQGFTRTHQLAQAVCYTSPLTCWADKPSFYLESEAKDIIMTIPVLWEKTVVLEPSDPGKLAAIARFDGENWFVGIMNGEKNKKELTLDLGFLGNQLYDANLLGDNKQGDPLLFDRSFLHNLTGDDKLTVHLNPAGGFVAKFLLAND